MSLVCMSCQLLYCPLHPCVRVQYICLHNPHYPPRCKDDDKNYLISIGMVGDLKTIVDGFMYNADLIAEAFSVIACLSDMGKPLQ